MEQIIQFDRFEGVKKYSSHYGQLGDDYIFSRIVPGEDGIETLSHPVRFAGMTVCLVLNGELSIDVNLTTYTVKPNSIVVLGSGSIIKVNKVDWSKLEAYTLFVSTNFLHDLNLDLNAINIKQMIERRVSPAGNLSPEEAAQLKQYMELLHLNATQNREAVFSKNIARSLIQAVIYQMLQFEENHTGHSSENAKQPQSRKLNYVHEFMTLVQLHHTHERSIAFYAEKLFISPKYLSHIIKEATGRSAATWIDEFVILEAKNMLRFSNKNIQQVAYALNFNTQSSFGKYFKHITGMSPTEYQKS